MTNESELVELDQDPIDAQETPEDLADVLTGKELGKLLWDKLTPQEQEAFAASWDEIERLFLYGDGGEPTGICAELVKAAPECGIFPKQVEQEMIQRILRAGVEAIKTIIDVIAEPVRILIDKFNEIFYYDDYKYIDFIGERDEAITRGLRDRSPTTRTISARYAQTSGARDAQRAGCLAGLPALSRS